MVAVGSISSFWGSFTESILLTIFVVPELHGQGIGRLIIETLENDELFLRAERIEIPASITAVEFYRKQGYDFKNGMCCYGGLCQDERGSVWTIVIYSRFPCKCR